VLDASRAVNVVSSLCSRRRRPDDRSRTATSRRSSREHLRRRRSRPLLFQRPRAPARTDPSTPTTADAELPRARASSIDSPSPSSSPTSTGPSSSRRGSSSRPGAPKILEHPSTARPRASSTRTPANSTATTSCSTTDETSTRRSTRFPMLRQQRRDSPTRQPNAVARGLHRARRAPAWPITSARSRSPPASAPNELVARASKAAHDDYTRSW
jgi:hypothetical protein